MVWEQGLKASLPSGEGAVLAREGVFLQQHLHNWLPGLGVQAVRHEHTASVTVSGNPYRAAKLAILDMGGECICLDLRIGALGSSSPAAAHL